MEGGQLDAGGAAAGRLARRQGAHPGGEGAGRRLRVAGERQVLAAEHHELAERGPHLVVGLVVELGREVGQHRAHRRALVGEAGQDGAHLGTVDQARPAAHRRRDARPSQRTLDSGELRVGAGQHRLVGP
ncbi:MAG: hypothetical protein R2699_09765 [Acidimicrobiales bacterium]